MSIQVTILEENALVGSATTVKVIEGIFFGQVDSVNGKTGQNIILDPDDLDDTNTDHKFVSQQFLDDVAESDVLSHAMSQADFEALQETRKRDNAGSGFLEWGNHISVTNDFPPVNEGIWTQNMIESSDANIFHIGRRSSDNTGISRSEYPIALVNGIQHGIVQVNDATSNKQNTIKFPQAPDGTKTYDSSTGVVTTHTTAAEAFEGNITNGDFRNGTTSWSGNGNSILSVTDGIMTLTASGGWGQLYSTRKSNITGVADYVVEFHITEATTVDCELRWQDGADAINDVIIPAGSVGRFTLEGSYDGALVKPGIVVRGDGANVKLSSMSVRKASESVITSRKDLVFLETWHEKISDKGVVYPLGNVQYAPSDYKGITLAINGIAQGYSAFGEWDSVTVGRNAVWANLSDAEQQIFLADSDNNIYLSEEGELIQIRYRVRTVEGLGDNWEGVYPNTEAEWAYEAGGSGEWYIQPRGSSTTSEDFNTGRNYLGLLSGNSSAISKEVSHYTFRDNQSDKAYKAAGAAIPICLVQRLNVGAYHPTYNPQGCARFNTTTTSSVGNQWNAGVTIDPVSTNDCFRAIPDSSADTSTSGYVVGTGDINSGSGGTGRSDHFAFYDAIYAGLVEDLRLDANKREASELLSEYTKKAVGDNIRGKEKVPFTHYLPVDNGTYKYRQAGGLWYTYSDSISSTLGTHQVGDFATIYNATEGTFCHGRISIVNVGNYAIDPAHPDTTVTLINTNVGAGDPDEVYFMVADTLNGIDAEYDSLPMKDVIGSPDRIVATFPDGFIGQWIPEIPIASGSQAFPFNKKNYQYFIRTYTTNDGASWATATGSTPISAITNTYTQSVATNMVMIHEYRTQATPYEEADNATIIGELGDSIYGSWYQENVWCGFQQALLGKVSINNADESNMNSTLKDYQVRVWSGDTLGAAAIYKPSHDQFKVTQDLNGGSGMKAFPYITEENGLYYLQWVYKEVLWDDALDTPNDLEIVNTSASYSYTSGNQYKLAHADFGAMISRAVKAVSTFSNTATNIGLMSLTADGRIIDSSGIVRFELWNGNGTGDDNTFTIVDGESTITDDNGNKVLVGQKRTLLPNINWRSE